jgi:alpha-mannosidase
MALNPEARDRIGHWLRVLADLFYTPVGSFDLKIATTFDHLRPEAARALPFRPIARGEKWGDKWEYAWLAAQFTLPESAQGERIVVALDVGAEGLVWINGEMMGGRDREHSYTLLTLAGGTGTTYDLFAECYANHRPIKVGDGPIPHGFPWMPEHPSGRAVIGDNTFGIWDETLYQLWLDATTLWELREKLDPTSLRVDEIDRGLMDMTLLADVEVPRADLRAGAAQARARLAPLLACRNGCTAPLLTAFGHSHIDVAWLWPLQETERKVARTGATQLHLMDEYPEYVFLHSQPHLYLMMKKHYPELYERVCERVKTGQWIPEGGSWVEPDTNVPSGESLIRQFIHGKRFFRQEFGVECEMFWEPDVFGYSAALPQIMLGCGLKYFGTQKIMWGYNEGDPFPYNQFHWQGIDGSRVLAHIFHGYGYHTSPVHLIDAWKDRAQKSGSAELMLPFGYGDGGGGATRNHLEFLRRARDLEGAPRTRQTSPLTFFHEMETRAATLPAYVGELYLQAHRGTYTSQARTKLGNRKSELALREAEFWATAASALAGQSLPLSDLDAAWKIVLLNQFHDILPGSSIARVYEEAEQGYAQVLEIAACIVASATGALTGKHKHPSTAAGWGSAHDARAFGGDFDHPEWSGAESKDAPLPGALTVFNSLSFARTALIALPWRLSCATDEAGLALPRQSSEDTTYVEVAVPPCGWSAIHVSDTPLERAILLGTNLEKADVVKVGAHPSLRSSLERTPLSAAIETFTETLSLDATPSNGHGSSGADGNRDGGFAAALAVARPAPLLVPSLAHVPEAVTVRAEGEYAILENGLLRATFDRSGELVSLWDKVTEREWMAAPGNAFRMWKDVPRNWDSWDIDSNYVEQPVELSSHATIEPGANGPLLATLRITRRLNNSPVTQEVRLRRNSRRIDFVTIVEWQEKHRLLKVAFPVTVHAEEALHEIQFGHVRRPNHTSRKYDADRFEVPQQRWTALAEEGRGAAVLNDCKYGVNVVGNAIQLTLLKAGVAPDPHADEGKQRFTYSLCTWNGSFLENDLVREAYDLNVPATLAEGIPSVPQFSLFSVDAANVMIEAVKPAEDGSGDVIVRLYEAKRTATRCALSIGLPVKRAARTNMLEVPERDLPLNDSRIVLDLRPFEIVTVRLAT